MPRWTDDARREASEKMKGNSYGLGKNLGNPGGGFKGRKHSAETKMKMSQAAMGNKNAVGHGRPVGYSHTVEFRKMMSEKLKGKNGPNYIDGKGRERARKRNQIRQTVEYKLWREAVFKRDSYTCQIYAAQGVELHGDHIKGWAEYPDLRFDVDNGRALCVPCHHKVTWPNAARGGV